MLSPSLPYGGSVPRDVTGLIVPGARRHHSLKHHTPSTTAPPHPSVHNSSISEPTRFREGWVGQPTLQLFCPLLHHHYSSLSICTPPHWYPECPPAPPTSNMPLSAPAIYLVQIWTVCVRLARVVPKLAQTFLWHFCVTWHICDTWDLVQEACAGSTYLYCAAQ